MALEILGFIRHHRGSQSPTRLVRCTKCGHEYARTGSASDIRKSAGCGNCASKRRRLYPDVQARRRAENQRYWARRKLREAGAA